MSDRDLLDVLYERIDAADADRMALLSTGFSLIQLVEIVAELVPDGVWQAMDPRNATAARDMLAQAVDRLSSDGGQWVAGVNVAALQARLAVAGRAGDGR